MSVCLGVAHGASPQRDATDVKRSPWTFPVDVRAFKS